MQNEGNFILAAEEGVGWEATAETTSTQVGRYASKAHQKHTKNIQKHNQNENKQH